MSRRVFFYFIFLALPTITAQPVGRDKIPQIAKFGAKAYHRKYLDENPVDNVENQLAGSVDVEKGAGSRRGKGQLFGRSPPRLGLLGTQIVQDAVVREPAPGKITRIVEVQKVKDTIDKSNATKSKGVPTIQGLEEEIQILGWTKPPTGYLGIGGIMMVEFLWTITRIDFNTTSELEMIYLDKDICRLREKSLGKRNVVCICQVVKLGTRKLSDRCV